MIKVGLCGAGFMGQMHAACYAAIPGVQITAVADKRSKFAQRVAKPNDAKTFTNARELINKADVDMVDICMPTFMHCSHVSLAAKRGLDCFCEKPISRTLGEAKRMVKAVRAAKIKFAVGHVIRFWPEYTILKDYVVKKRLGRLYALSLWRFGERPTFGWRNWFQKPLLSGGAFLDLHIHDVDYLRYLLGDPDYVDSVGSCRLGAWDHVSTNYQYGETAVNTAASWTAADPFDMAFRAVFEKGTLCYSLRHEPLTLYAPRKKPRLVRIPKPKAGKAAAGGNISDLGGYFIELKYFIDCLKKNRYPEVITPEDAHDSLALVFRELASARKKLKLKPKPKK